ncbi:alpha/beta hydrolase [Kribbella shirazensis]|uniref:Pimeloyl-ACP methyl ester carboxylesterase n=1 Tax=Kribbella shirazensis TaxID=1105143 RepID=A0A7X5VHK4_9ACTN|nr:alpha/beta hydrolase [Kribbella shirazensis]NIK61348.1 pimeloyl-ACP methyl ester carboxylesterase [Kribbella shirazensis]
MRRGILLINPGGPGNAGLLLPPQLAAAMPAEARDRYDLVGFDPRSVGRSAPITCGLTTEEQNYLLLPPQSFAADVDRQAGIAAKCARVNGPLLRFMTTRNTARDMDVIRGALGEPKLSYLGYSYGTYLGSVYTQMFGTHADRIVLDSVVNPDVVWRDLTRAMSPAVEVGLNRWAAWTAGRNEQYVVGTSGPAVRARFDRLIADGNRVSLPVDDMRLTGEHLRMIAFAVMYDDRLYPVLSDLIRVMVNGGRLQPAVRDYVAGALTPPPHDNAVAAQLAIICDDVKWTGDLDLYRRDKIRDGHRYPLYGATAATVKPCTFWPYRPIEPVTTIGPGNAAPGILLVQSELDTATPAAGAHRLHELLLNSRLVTLRNAQKHIVYLTYGNTCVDTTVTRYLVTGQLPAADVACTNTSTQSDLRQEAGDAGRSVN